MLAVIGFLGSAAPLAGEAKSRPTPPARALIVTAVLLGACGVWWPGHLTHGQESTGPIAVLGLSLAWLVSGLALMVTTLASRSTLPAFGAASLAMLAAAYGLGVVASPGLLKLLRAESPMGSWVVVFLLALALAAIQKTDGAPALQRHIRAGGALVAAAVLTLGAWHRHMRR